MDVKPIQDIIPPRPASPVPPSGPEIVHDIPLRQPSPSNSLVDSPVGAPSGFVLDDQDENSNEPSPTSQLPKVNKKDLLKPIASKTKESKPLLASLVLAVAIICLALGTYIKFHSGS